MGRPKKVQPYGVDKYDEATLQSYLNPSLWGSAKSTGNIIASLAREVLELRAKVQSQTVISTRPSIAELLAGYIEKNPQSIPYGCSDRHLGGLRISGTRHRIVTNALVSGHWVVGGLTGGSCWGTNADKAITADEPPESWELMNFLKVHVGNISILQYQDLLGRVRNAEYTNSEYYGNYTEYRFKYILFDDIIDVLKTD